MAEKGFSRVYQLAFDSFSKTFTCLFSAVLGLPRCTLVVAVHRSLVEVASSVAECGPWGLQASGPVAHGLIAVTCRLLGLVTSQRVKSSRTRN